MDVPGFDVSGLPAHGEPVVLAASAGRDSQAMLQLLARTGLWRIHAVHVDHGLRTDTDLDHQTVRALAQRHGLAVEVLRVDVAAERRSREGVEACARRLRYAALASAAQRLGASVVVTAHHAQDQAETILLHLLRGAGERGLAGMPAVRPLAAGVRLVRPGLACLPEDLFAAAGEVPWHADSTNADTALRRNFIRHRVLPTFEAGCPGFTRALIVRGQTSIPPRLPVGTQEPLPVSRLRLRDILAELGCPLRRATVAALAELAAAPAGPAFACGGWLFRRHGEALRWEIEHPDLSPQCWPLAGPGRWRCGSDEIDLVTGPPPSQPRGDGAHAWIDAGCVVGALVWRRVVPGERWIPLGCSGSQSVLHTLAGRGVPAGQRRASMVLADDGGPLWVPLAGPAQRARITPGTAFAHAVAHRKIL